MLPAAFLFIIGVIYLLDIFRIHSEVGAIVNESGNKMIEASYGMGILEDEFIEDDKKKKIINLTGGLVVSEAYVKNQIKKSGVFNEIKSLSVYLYANEADNELTISASYKVEPLVKIPGFEGYILSNSFFSKMYLGESGKVEETDYVYVTKDSEVYHTSKECQRLKKTVSMVFMDELESKRNKDGKKYYRCEACKDYEGTGLVYITEYGTRYHKNPACSDLKVNVYKIPSCQTGERKKCYFCE